MSEVEKNDAAEADQLNAEELDTVAGGVLGLQELDGGDNQTEALSSLASVGCICSDQ